MHVAVSSQSHKFIRQKRRKMLFMKVFHWNNIVAGLVVLMFAAILLGDAILVTYTSADEVFSPNDVKGITGLVFIIIAGFILIKARESK
jgi:uncharacterized membrane protein